MSNEISSPDNKYLFFLVGILKHQNTYFVFFLGFVPENNYFTQLLDSSIIQKGGGGNIISQNGTFPV